MRNHFNAKASFEKLDWGKRPICGKSANLHKVLTTSDKTKVDCENCKAKLEAIK